MHFKELDQKTILDILSEEEDVLTPRSKADAAFYDDIDCVRCGGDTTIEAHTQAMLASGTTRNKYMCRCTVCGCLFDPYFGIIVEMGNLGRLERPVPLIHNDD